MCRLAAITSDEYLSPMEAVLALETMHEGHDGSGMGLLLKNLGGEFSDLKDYPILSGICSNDGLRAIDQFMWDAGFRIKHEWRPVLKQVGDIKRRDHYFAKAYDYPEEFKERSFLEKEDLLLRTRLALRAMGENNQSVIVFSFYPDVLAIKEVGDPLQLSEFFGLNDSRLKAKIVFAQGRQNTNYDINLYACHPFFIQGFASMTNGENTAFVPIKEYLMSRGVPGYMGYNSDSEVFTHILHFTVRQLGYPLNYYKDIITPLKSSEIERRLDREALLLLRSSLRPLCIDGPNMVIGFTPDGTCFMVHDSKKLRPGSVGGMKGRMALVSEECGLDSAMPDRDRSLDIFPMKYDMVIVSPGAEEARIWNQLYGWTTIIS
jgi:glutamate synthase domain-containing protein 1